MNKDSLKILLSGILVVLLVSTIVYTVFYREEVSDKILNLTNSQALNEEELVFNKNNTSELSDLTEQVRKDEKNQSNSLIQEKNISSQGKPLEENQIENLEKRIQHLESVLAKKNKATNQKKKKYKEKKQRSNRVSEKEDNLENRVAKLEKEVEQLKKTVYKK